MSLTRFPTHVKNKLNHSPDLNLFNCSLNLNECSVFNIAELFSYWGTFEPPILHLFVSKGQSTATHMDFVVTCHGWVATWQDELHMLLIEVLYRSLIDKKDCPPWSAGLMVYFNCYHIVGSIICSEGRLPPCSVQLLGNILPRQKWVVKWGSCLPNYDND